jgi:hypothetical protein
MEINSIILTNALAKATFLFFQIKTAIIDISNKRYRLSKEDMNSFVLGYILIELIRIFNRAIFYTGSTTCAFVLFNISRFFNQVNLEVPCFTFNTFYFSIAQDLYIRMPADLDQFR